MKAQKAKFSEKKAYVKLLKAQFEAKLSKLVQLLNSNVSLIQGKKSA